MISLSCQNNLRQLGAGILQYHSDYDGRVLARYPDGVNAWPYALDKGGYVPMPPQNKKYGATSNMVWLCPGYPGHAFANIWSSGYAIPQEDGLGPIPGSHGLSLGSVLTRTITRKSDRVLILEGEWAAGNTGKPAGAWPFVWCAADGAGWNNTDHQAGRWRHVGDTTNLTFYDGRAETLPWTSVSGNKNDMFRHLGP